jgi:hypothetical protein
MGRRDVGLGVGVGGIAIATLCALSCSQGLGTGRASGSTGYTNASSGGHDAGGTGGHQGGSTTGTGGSSSTSGNASSSSSSGVGSDAGIDCVPGVPGVCACVINPPGDTMGCGPSVGATPFCCASSTWPAAGSECACGFSYACNGTPTGSCACAPGQDAGADMPCTGTTCCVTHTPGVGLPTCVCSQTLTSCSQFPGTTWVQVPSCAPANYLQCAQGYTEVTACR